MKISPYIYSFVRKDIPTEAQIVQTGHAMLEAGFAFDDPGCTCRMVVLEAHNEDHLLMISRYLEYNGVRYKMFFEPDNNMGHSAIATEPIFGERRRKIFNKFNLVKHRA